VKTHALQHEEAPNNHGVNMLAAHEKVAA